MNAPSHTQHVRITQADDPLLAAIWPLYEQAFPLCEKRTRDAHIARLGDPRFICRVYTQFVMTPSDSQQAAVALLFYWNICELRYIEHLAISVACRGTGLGSTLLTNFLHEDTTPVALGIDERLDALAERRWHFYERLGFTQQAGIHLHPPYQIGHKPHRLHILTSTPDFSAAQRTCFIDTIEHDVVGAPV